MLGMVYRVIRQGLIDMEAMFRLIDTPPEISDAPGAEPLVVDGGAVAFDNVVFGYEPDRTILNGVSFAVGAGETLAIVGPSGAGKSTIARLLFRFYDPQGGLVSVDGVDVRDADPTEVRNRFAWVSQEAPLFSGSANENIRFGRELATTGGLADTLGSLAKQRTGMRCARPSQP